MLLPLGFDAYARIFIEYFEETAEERDERLTEALREPMPGADQDEQVARSAFLPGNKFEPVLHILARHTSLPISWFLLWDGHGNLNDRGLCVRTPARHAPAARQGHRSTPIFLAFECPARGHRV